MSNSNLATTGIGNINNSSSLTRLNRLTVQGDSKTEFLVNKSDSTNVFTVDTITPLVTTNCGLTVNGTLTYNNITVLTTTNPEIELANGNLANTFDIGFYGQYSLDGVTPLYLGLYRDHTDSRWKIYDGLVTEPTTTVPGGYNAASLQIANLYSTRTFISDGSVSNPSLAFTSETGSGLYRIGSSDIGFSISGTKILELLSTGTITTGDTKSTTFTIGSTSLNSTNFGFLQPINQQLTTTSSTSFNALSLPGGSLASPSLNIGTGTGLYQTTPNILNVAAGGVRVCSFLAGSITMAGSTDILGINNLTVNGISTLNGAVNAGSSTATFNNVIANTKVTTPAFQLTTGSTLDFVLRSDGLGNGTWVGISSLPLVYSATGSANGVLVNGTSGSSQIGALTFTLDSTINTNLNGQVTAATQNSITSIPNLTTVGTLTSLTVSPSGAVSAPTATTTLNVAMNAASRPNIAITGVGFNGSSATDGIGFSLLNNSSDNRQLYVGDTARLTSGTTYAGIRMIPGTIPLIDAVYNNGTSIAPMQIGNSGNNLTIAASNISIQGQGIVSSAWQYVNSLNQSVSTTANPTHASLTTTNSPNGTIASIYSTQNNLRIKTTMDEISGNASLFAVETNTTTNPMRLDFAYVGNATVASRRFNIQTTQTGVASAGILGVQTTAGDTLIGNTSGNITLTNASLLSIVATTTTFSGTTIISNTDTSKVVMTDTPKAGTGYFHLPAYILQSGVSPIYSGSIGNSGINADLSMGVWDTATGTTFYEGLVLTRGSTRIVKAMLPVFLNNTTDNTNGNLTSGTYTPTFTNVTNTGTLTNNGAHYKRIGSEVSVQGSMTFAATATASDYQFRISLPIASNFGSLYQLIGSGHIYSNSAVGSIYADTTNDAGQFVFSSAGVNGTTYTVLYSFTYTII